MKDKTFRIFFNFILVAPLLIVFVGHWVAYLFAILWGGLGWTLAYDSYLTLVKIRKLTEEKEE